MFVPLLVLRNAFRHRLRTTLTVVGIIVAIVAFGLLRTIVDAWYAGANASSSARLVTRSSVSLVFALPLSYAQKIRQVDGVTAVGWDHEKLSTVADVDDPTGVLQLQSRLPFGAGGDTTQRITFYPDLKTSDASRAEGEVTAQAAMSAHLALKLGYLVRYSHTPVPGFKKTDNTTTASIVLRFRSDKPAPR